MKDKLLLPLGLGCLALALYFSEGGGNPALDDGAAGAGAGGRPLFRSSHRERGNEKRQARRTRPDITAADRAELVKALDVAANSRNDEDLARLVSEHAAGDYARVMRSIQDDGGFGASKEQILRAFVRCWAVNDPDSAIEWAKRLPEWQRDAVFTGVCLEAASREPAKAMDAVLQTMDERVAGELAENISDSWAARDLPGLVGWAKAVPAGGLRDRIFVRAVGAQAEKDPEGAVALMLEEIPAGELQQQAAISIARQWALRSPSDASRWVEALASPELRGKARAELDAVSLYRGTLRGYAPENPAR